MICRYCAENEEMNWEMRETEIRGGHQYFCSNCLTSIKIQREGNETKTITERLNTPYKTKIEVGRTVDMERFASLNQPVNPQKTVRGRGLLVEFLRDTKKVLGEK